MPSVNFLRHDYLPHDTINVSLNLFQTRMHSSGMRTSHSLTVCQGGLLLGVSAPGGCLLPKGVSAPGGVSAAVGVVVSEHALRQTPPVNRMTNRCKNITLAATKFVAASNDVQQTYFILIIWQEMKMIS